MFFETTPPEPSAETWGEFVSENAKLTFCRQHAIRTRDQSEEWVE